jgi:hypothetical protein
VTRFNHQATLNKGLMMFCCSSCDYHAVFIGEIAYLSARIRQMNWKFIPTPVRKFMNAGPTSDVCYMPGPVDFHFHHAPAFMTPVAQFLFARSPWE